MTFYGADADDSLRYVTLGDLNGDGQPDLLLGADFASGPAETRPGAGEAYVFGGPLRAGVIDLAAPSPAPDLTVYGADGLGAAPGFGDLLGILAAGDLDGDGIDDLIASAQFADGPANARADAGEVYVFRGSPCAFPSHPPKVRPPHSPRAPRSPASCLTASSR